MTTPKPEPASDALVDAFIADWPNDDRTEADGIEVDAGDLRSLLARVEADRARSEADRARIKTKDEEIARLGDALTTLENRLFGLAELTPICQLHRHGLSAMVDFIRAALSKPKPEPGR